MSQKYRQRSGPFSFLVNMPRRRKPIFATATAALLAGTLLVVPASAAAAAPAKKLACPADRPDEAAALVTARLCDGEVEIAGQTDEYDEGFAQPNGQVRWEHHYRPVRVARASGWVPVDTTLSLQSDGTVKPAATAVDLAFSG